MNQIGSRYNQHSFAQIPAVNTPRSAFDRSFEVKDTYDFDYIYPFYCDEVIPGDTFNVDVNIFARLATQKVPIMDRLYASYEFFFVPSRLVWSNFRKMMGEQDNPGDSTDYTVPKLAATTAGGFTVGSIYDKFGLPTGIASLTINNALPFRCYNLIYNTWYRDQNLIGDITVPLTDGPDALNTYALQKRGKAHDYFTSCLPWPQKGDAVSLPLGTQARIYGDGNASTGQPRVVIDGTSRNMIVNNATADLIHSGANAGSTQNAPWANVDQGAYADLTNATAATINQLREAMLMQSLFELDARGGTRFTEVILAHFNTVLPDFTAQRPEYLGGGHFDINSHPVAQNSATGVTGTPQANLASFATHMVNGRSLGFNKSFSEWGYVIGMVTFRAALTYQQGINRMWNRETRYDFYWPKLAGLGEQAVYNKEIYAQGTAADANVFGYQERYSEYKYKPSEIRGVFRSQHATSLDVWHMAEEFGSLPALNQTFIESNTPIERSIVVTGDEPQIIFDAFIKQTCVRPMPVYNVPATFGRF